MNAHSLEATSNLVATHQRKHPDYLATIESERLGPQIKRIRQVKNLTLKALSQKSGLSESTLSKIENNRLSPSFQLLQTLLQALEVTWSQLTSSLKPDLQLSRRSLTRKAEGPLHQTPSYAHRLLAHEIKQKKLLPFTSTIHARSIDSFKDWVRHDGEEFLLVLSGAVELHCEHYEPVRLEAGDSSYFDSSMGHALVSVSEDDAEVLWVASLN
ncbi:XRE family transcriptional regulator [Motiliproteus coralliicola]|uniref:XRE family transcriptional regulator n=1 Tax=Motiliproteus coralliicola TaxID=2283196 RepID=A0A369WQL7_9GAMM|nr:XRE family transcriptional regulator [Motiliproteus coralliicola]RDE22856.1 XRE family transcriptional regulator [Motiliproteus coralliicola]